MFNKGNNVKVVFGNPSFNGSLFYHDNTGRKYILNGNDYLYKYKSKRIGAGRQYKNYLYKYKSKRIGAGRQYKKSLKSVPMKVKRHLQEIFNQFQGMCNNDFFNRTVDGDVLTLNTVNAGNGKHNSLLMANG